MENDGLIIRTVYPEVPPRVEYSLSELGLTLKPILDSMLEWGNAYKKNVGRIFNGSNIKKTPSLYIKISFTYTKEGDTKNSLCYEFFYLSVLNNVCDWFPWSFSWGFICKSNSDNSCQLAVCFNEVYKFIICKTRICNP